jgi:hypothetical protein
MPTPPLPGAYEAQVVLTSDTGFPRDSVVNTFHFDPVDITPPDIAKRAWIADTLISFYNDVHGTGSNQVRWYLSSTLNQGDLACSVKVYNMGDAHPRIPYIQPFTLAAPAGSDNGMPSEVAICLSFKSTEAANPKRGRGRIYLGPLHSNVVLLDAPNIRMNGATTLAIQHAARFLMDAGTTGAAQRSQWSIYSRADNALYGVTSAYVDNEFDTQRRRGHRATARVFA